VTERPAHNPPAAPSTGKSILYLAPTFLADRRDKQIRGVQVFDLQFIRDLIALGHRVTVPADATWRPRFAEHLGPEIASARLTIGPCGRFRKPLWNGLWAAASIKGRYDIAFLGNPVRGMVPPIDLMLRRAVFSKLVLQANRAPRSAVVPALRRWPITLTAVSKLVKDNFPADLQARVAIEYGIVNWREFVPSARQTGEATGAGQDDGLVHTCVLGALDNAWKGADLAIEAYTRLPDALRAKARLHLASYARKPANLPTGVIAHDWMAATAMPAFMRTMDIMAVPSTDNETFSQAMVQGMLAGLPCITSWLPVLTEKLDAGGGVSFADVGEFAQHWATLIQSPSLRHRMGAAARQTALERYCWDSAGFVDRYF